MQTKLFKVLDRATELVIMVTKLEGNEQEQQLLNRVGYGKGSPNKILVTDMLSKETKTNPYSWDRTIQLAHEILMEKFDELESGSIIDVTNLE